VHVITRKRLNDFAALHPPALTTLERWYRLMKRNNFGSFAELRVLFPSADQVGNRTVFNLGGNKYRLIAAIHYNRHRIYIRHIFTHVEYDKNNWKDS